MRTVTRLAAALVASSLIALPPALAADRRTALTADRLPEALSVSQSERVTRVAGADRYETAAMLYEGYTEDFGAPDVLYVASGQDYADALSASASAGSRYDLSTIGAPLLLTKKDVLPAPTSRALRELAPKRIVVIGGAAAVSDAVVAQLKALPSTGGRVSRIAGTDRYDTSARVARHLKTGWAPDSNPGRVAYLVTGQSYADALAAGWVGASRQAPVLLTRSDRLPPATLASLKNDGWKSVVIVGGEKAVTPAVADQVRATGVSVQRVAGSTRYGTAAAVSRHAEKVGATDPERLLVTYASGESYADALAAGAASGALGAPLLLTKKDALPAETATETRRVDPLIGTIFGGTAAVSTTVEAQLDAIIAEGQ